MIGSARVWGFDYVSLGNWRNLGKDGYAYVNSGGASVTENLPDFIESLDIETRTVNGTKPITVRSTSQFRLQISDESFTDGAWSDNKYSDSSGDGVLISIKTNDGLPHAFSMFTFDNESHKRWQLTVWDYGMNNQLSDTFPTPSSFTYGAWIRMAFQGDVKLIIDNTSVPTASLYLNALLFDPWPQGIAGLENIPGNYIT